jgi:ubiquinone/menaquinone biosynthesis C-methylase UbiE
LANTGHAAEPQAAGALDSPAKGDASRFAERVFDDSARMLCGALSYIGDRLGLFKAMAQLGECTPMHLATATHCNDRLITEWLKAMMACEYIEYLPNVARFRLSPEQSAVLADEDSAVFMGGILESTVPLVMATQEIMNSFTSGVPITPDLFHSDYWEGIDRANAITYQHQLAQEWLSEMPDVIELLSAGGKAVDVGCGQGNAVIVLAQRFPCSKFVGYDPYRPSIDKARQAATLAGVADRTEFIVGTAEDLPVSEFELATSFLTIHHMSHPVRDLTAIRRALTPTGRYLIREDNLPNELRDHTTPVARLAYASSAMACLHDSMAKDGAALGPLPEARITNLVRQAGFSRLRRLPIESAYDAIYEAKN